MKNQNDLIVAGAVVLVCIGVSLAFMFQRRTPDTPPAPTAVVTSDAQPAAANIAYAAAGSAPSGSTPRASQGPRIAGAAGG